MSKENIINLLSPNNNIEFTIKSIENIECCSYIDLSERFSDAIGVLIIETNRFSLIINSESVIPQENMMVLLGAGNKINISPIDPMFPLYLHILCIGQPDFDDLKLLKEKFFFYQPANILPYVEKFNEIHSNIVRNDFTSKLYIKMRLYEFIYDLANDYRSLAKSTDIYSQIKAYIDSHFTDILSIQFLSDLFGVSYKTIERKFKANSGLTPQQYVTDLRMNKACEYLQETTMNIETIALALGYQDKFYFSRAFKKNLKTTPSEYRSTHTTIPKSSSSKLQQKRSDARNIVISNYNRVTVYRMIPKRIVCLSFFAAEVCVALGLADRIIGMVETEGAISDCKSEYRSIIEGLHIIPKSNKRMPAFDTIDAMLPDFVYGASFSFLEQSGIADASEFEKHGMNIYVSKATYSTLSTMHDVYEDIYSIGKIFDKTEQARLIVKDMQCELQMIKEKLSETEPKRVFLYTAEIDNRVLSVGMGLESHLLKMAKGINVFENYPQQRILREWADVAKENPEIIIIHESAVDDPDMIIGRIRNNSILKNVSAVMNNQIYSIRLEHTFPGLHNIDVIKQFALYLHGCVLDENIQQL